MDPEKGALQKLLLQEEYSDLEDIVIVEGTFVEVDKCGDAVQQVVLGISPDHLFMGRRQVLNWKEDPMITLGLYADLEVYGLELKWITPLRYVDISPISDEYVLKVSSKHSRSRYFELCTFQERDDRWYRWLDRIKYLKDDPYGYISSMLLHKESGTSLTTSEANMSSDYSVESLKPGTLELDLSISDTEQGKVIHPEASNEEKKSETMPLLASEKIKPRTKGSKRKSIFSRFWKRVKSKERVNKGEGKR